MKDSKVLSLLCFKVRVRTLSLYEQGLNNILVYTKQIQSHSFFSYKQKGKTNNFGWYFLNMYGTSAYNKTRIYSTFSKVQVLQSFLIKKSCCLTNVCKYKKQSLYVRTYNKVFTYKSSTYKNSVFVRTAFVKGEIINQPTVWLNKAYRTESVQKLKDRFLQYLVQSAEISLLKGCEKRYLGRRCLLLNDIVDYKIVTLRFSDQSFPKWEKYKMIRPLLDLKRETITMVCKEFKMPVYPDQSNRSVQYSRNRIRKQIIPSIKYFMNPQVEDSLFKLAELLNKEQIFLYSVLRNR